MMRVFRQPNELHLTFSNWLITSLTTIVQSVKGDAHHLNKEKLWMKFHELTVSLEFANKWKEFTAKLDISAVPPLLYQHVTDTIFEKIIKDSFSLSVPYHTAASTPVMEERVALTYEEENAVHYVGGYVIRELKKDN